MAERARRPRTLAVAEVMGTVFSIAASDPLPAPQAVAAVIAWLRRADATFSPFRPASDVSRLNRGELDDAQLGAEMTEIIGLCAQARAVTSGYFDAWAGGRFDPCGLVKGWAIEVASGMLAAAGAANHCVNGGGDIRCAGQPAAGRCWRIGVADPVRPGRLAAVVVGADAVATSGRAERGEHVIDPHTGLPARGLASVTVTGQSLTWADAYATAAFAMGGRALAWLRELPEYAGLVVTAGGAAWSTPRFPGDEAQTQRS